MPRDYGYMAPPIASTLQAAHFGGLIPLAHLALIDHKSGSEYLKKMFSSAGQRRVAFGAEVFRNERSDLGCRRPQAGQ